MSRSNKSEIAVTLLSALTFGANAQAKDSSQNQIVKTGNFQINSTNSVQNSGKLDRVSIGEKQMNWKKIAKIGGITAGGLAGVEAIHSIFGFTNLAIGKGSLGRLIKERGKKDDLPDDHGKPDVDTLLEARNVVINCLRDSFGQVWLAQAASNFIELVSDKRDVLEKDNCFAPLLNIFNNTVGVFNCRAINIQSGYNVEGKFSISPNFTPFYLFSIVVKDSSAEDRFHEYVVFPSGNKFKIYANTAGISKNKAEESLEVVDFKDYEARFQQFKSIELNAESTKLSEQFVEVPEQNENGLGDDLVAMLKSLNCQQ